jgi:hypothetical protein
MRVFSKEEIQKRAELVTLCSQLYSLFNEKREELAVDWKEEFNKGGITHVEQLFQRTLQVVDQQMRTVSQLSELIRKQHREHELAEAELDKHTHYTELVKAHFSFSDIAGNLIKKEELDVEKISSILMQIYLDLKQQKDTLEAVRKKGAGRQAYIEIDVRRLAEKEMALLKDIRPFWKDWETVVVKVESILSNIGEASDEQLAAVREEIEQLLGIYHSQFANNNRAPQMGTELAINLYIQPTDEVYKLGNKIPIAIINIDVTGCNIIDDSHELGNKLIDIGYEELERRLRRNFRKLSSGDKNRDILGKGVVTILGRTRYKIVGVPKDEIEKHLKELPDVVMNRLREQDFVKRYEGMQKKRFERLNTVMLGGYVDLKVGEDRELFAWKLIELGMNNDDFLRDSIMLNRRDIDAKVEAERLRRELKEMEKEIAGKIDSAIKQAAAKAEYLEKVELPKRTKARMQEFQRLEAEAQHHASLTPGVIIDDFELMQQAFSKFPHILVYADKIDDIWMGRNYVPEEEFEGTMINRLSHQIGLDTHWSREFLDFLKHAKELAKGNKLDPETAKKLQDLKERFYTEVLQKRALAKSYDLRMKMAIREEAYDQLLADMSVLEGPQIITFIELDGFNAFNRVYLPDCQDTYYHSVLKRIFDEFDNVFNRRAEDSYLMSMRMTKQGDEIWLSYPLNPARGRIEERQHVEFLDRVRRALISRDERYALSVDNKKTVRWVPYLIENEEEMMRHLDNCLSGANTSNDHRVFYVDNERFKQSEPQQLIDPHLEITAVNRKILNDSFRKDARCNKDEESFAKWKTLKNARETTGTGIFGPKSFKFAYMLFDETVKISDPNGSKRLNTGRIIRLGTTMGYAGFRHEIAYSTPNEVKEMRESLNKSVEILRKEKGRGGIHNLEKEGFDI